MSEKEKMAFFTSIASMTKTTDVLQAAEDLLETFPQQTEFYEDGGAFQPLEFWKRLGWCPDLIVGNSKPADVQQHSLGCTVYRVKVMSTGNRGEKGTRRSSLCKRKTRSELLEAKAEKTAEAKAKEAAEAEALKAAEVAAAAAAEAARLEAAKHSESDEDSPTLDSDSSSSSSNSSDDTKKKKKKKAKKAKKTKKVKKANKKKRESQPAETRIELKARQAAERVMEKERLRAIGESAKVRAKALGDHHKHAKEIVTKLSVLRKSFEALFAKPTINHVPTMIVDPAKAAFETIKSHIDAAAVAISSDEIKPLKLTAQDHDGSNTPRCCFIFRWCCSVCETCEMCFCCFDCLFV